MYVTDRGACLVVWYATAHLYSLYTAAEHSILALQQQGPACPWRLAAAADKQIERLSVVLQALSRSSWFTSCLGLVDDLNRCLPRARDACSTRRFAHKRRRNERPGAAERGRSRGSNAPTLGRLRAELSLLRPQQRERVRSVSGGASQGCDEASAY